jgi:hypothetical protein
MEGASVPIPKEILDLLFQGESDTLEFKTAIRDPLLLSRLIASFANAKGGKILVGVKEPPEVVGVDESQLRRMYEAALRHLAPAVQTSLAFVSADGLTLGTIEVAPSSELVLAQGSAFVRTGAMSRPMPWTQMRDRLPPERPEVNLQLLMRASEQQTLLLEKLSADNDHMKSELAKANDPAAKRKERIIGFLQGLRLQSWPPCCGLWLAGNARG